LLCTTFESMDVSYSLRYYEQLFDGRTTEFWELVSALEQQLEAYAADLSKVLATKDRAALARLRHTHRPMIENLALVSLKALEAEVKRALDEDLSSQILQDLADQFALEARSVARSLNAERFPNAPRPQGPFPGG